MNLFHKNWLLFRIGFTTLLFLFVYEVAAQPDLKKIDNYIAQAQKDWEAPGMAVAIVKDGKIVLESGYGVLEEGINEKVDEHTLFAIASNTKAFIASAIGTLVDQGKIDWRDPVIDHLPYFRLYDNYATQEAQIDDLLCHRLGLGTFSGDVIWYKSNYSAREVIERIPYVPQAYSFRAGYGYSNLMFITAGEAIQAASGISWDKYLKATFFDPLGMSRTVTSISRFDGMSNYATPHKIVDGKNVPIDWTNWDNMGAAGGIISSVHDMSQWMMLQLNHGIWKEDTIFSQTVQDEMWYPHNNYKITESGREFLPSRHFNGYGLGWGLYDLHGNMVVTHGGGYDGMYSRVAMVPDLNLGVVILTNTMNGISPALAYYIIDAYSEVPMRDWSKERMEAFSKGEKYREERVKERMDARIQNTSPTKPVSSLTGKYYDSMYGELLVVDSNGQLRLTFPRAPELDADLDHWHYDTFQLKWDEIHAWFGFGTVQFVSDNNGKVSGIIFDVPNDDIFFEEIHAEKIE